MTTEDYVYVEGRCWELFQRYATRWNVEYEVVDGGIEGRLLRVSREDRDLWRTS